MRNRLMLGGRGVPLRRLAGTSRATRRGDHRWRGDRLLLRPVLRCGGSVACIPFVGACCWRAEVVQGLVGPSVANLRIVGWRLRALPGWAALRFGRRSRWCWIRTAEAPWLSLLLVHAAEAKSSAFRLSAAFRLCVVLAEPELVVCY